MKHLICALGVIALAALPVCASTVSFGFGATNEVSYNETGTEGSWTEIGSLAGQQIDCVVAIGTTTHVCGDPGPGTAANIPITAPGAGTLPGTITNYTTFDGDPQFGAPIYTNMTGLTVGTAYILSFYQASSEETSATHTAYDDSWLAYLLPTADTTGRYICPQPYCATHSAVTAAPAGSREAFNGSTSATTYMATPAGGSTPWEQESFTFIATATHQVLEFVTNVASGSDGIITTGDFQPPMLDLADITLTSTTPEPSTWGLTLLGVGAVFAGTKLRRRSSSRT
jgi:hypothetical protein